MASTATANTIAGPLNLQNPTLTLTLGTGDNSALVTVSGNYQGLQLIFEGSVDGSTWFPLSAIRADRTAEDFGSSHGFPVAASPQAWRVAVAGLSNVRVRVAALASGSVTATIVSSAPFAS